MKERFLSDFLTRGKVFSFSFSFFIVFARWKIIASDWNIWVFGLPALSFQKVPFCLMGSQHSPLRRIPGIWSIHLSQNNQWAMDGIPSSAAHHSYFLIASSWLSIKAKPDFAFRDGRIEEGFLAPPCHLGMFWEESVTSSEWCKSSHVDKKAACSKGRTKDSLSTYPRGKTTHSWLCCNGAAELNLDVGAWVLCRWYAFCMAYAGCNMMPSHMLSMQQNSLNSYCRMLTEL